MGIYKAYFDESGTHDNSPLLCVAGYIVQASEAIKLDEKIRIVLKDFGLPYFHMVDCAHGSGSFKRMSKDDRIEAQKRMISAIKQHVDFGYAVSVNEKAFNEYVPRNEQFGTAYSFCARNCLTAIQSWIKKRHFNGTIEYHFESGHASQGEADAIMKRVFAHPVLRERHKYHSHAFSDKRMVTPLQAADILAWHWFTDCKRRMSGKFQNPRKDTESLMEIQRYEFLHYDDEMLKGIALGLEGKGSFAF